MAYTLTAKMEAFCKCIVIDGMNQTEAYKVSHGVGESSTHATIKGNACRAMQVPGVRERIQELRDMMAEKAEWTRLDSVRTLAEIARNGQQQKDKVAAVKALNAMFGWEKKTVDHTSNGQTIKSFNQLYGVTES